MTQTVTGTATYARFALLEMQVRTLLREAAGASTDSLEKVSKGLKAPHYIEQVAVQGLFRDGRKGAELRLSIDWRVHALAIKAGGSHLQVPSTWANSIAPSLAEAVRTFNQAVSIAALVPEWVVVYGSHWDRDTTNRLLGFQPAPVREWAKTPEMASFGFGPLTEASLVVGLAI